MGSDRDRETWRNLQSETSERSPKNSWNIAKRQGRPKKGNCVLEKARLKALGRRKRQDSKLTKAARVKSAVSVEVLDRIDIRVGTIELVEDIPRSEKLVRLTVDFGDHKRQIIVGLKQERANPKEVEGKQALFVVNLEPRRIMGEVSDGMLFDIGHADGITPVLVVPEKQVPNGTRAG